MMPVKVLSSLAVAAALLLLTYPAAADYSTAVKGACKSDYKRFCGVYAVNDPGLRKCMDQAGRSLSVRCVNALVEAGEVTKARAVQRWKQPIE
jgi:hypothetical protein